jgi:hypothetical protein
MIDEKICELLVNSEFEKEVYKKIKNIKEDEKYLVITFVDNKYYPIFEIFYKYYKKFNRKDLLIISLDINVYAKISKLGVATILLPFNISDRNYFWRYRLNIIKLIFEWSKMDIIHTDIDCIWLKDPIKYLLDNEYDVITQIEYGHPFHLSKKNGFVMCCGFMKFNYSEKTLNMLREVMDLKINDDQVSFNEYLFRNVLKVDVNKYNYSKSIELSDGIRIGILDEEICNRNNKFNNSYIFHPWLYPAPIKEKVSLLLKMLKKY